MHESLDVKNQIQGLRKLIIKYWKNLKFALEFMELLVFCGKQEKKFHSWRKENYSEATTGRETLRFWVQLLININGSDILLWKLKCLRQEQNIIMYTIMGP